ncbi:MAG: flagellar basal-body rod protein FlgB [Alteromonadaceae bacterium]|jgi:flagellar basal-body rod protein FlgB
MSFSLDKAFGIHVNTIVARGRRAEVLANNIANADTPNFKAKDLDFQQVMKRASSKQSVHIATTHEKHFKIAASGQSDTFYITPDQPDTGDGNTVDIQVERNKFLQNSMEYQASLRFLTGRISGLKKAITGQ